MKDKKNNMININHNNLIYSLPSFVQFSLPIFSQLQFHSNLVYSNQPTKSRHVYHNVHHVENAIYFQLDNLNVQHV